MGERVHVRTVRAQPVEDPAGRGVRIDYAKQDVQQVFPTFSKAYAWLHWFLATAALHAGQAWRTAIAPRLRVAVRDLGGGRQVGFAAGMMFTLGGLGAALTHEPGPVIWMTIGGLLIGFTVRVTGKEN